MAKKRKRQNAARKPPPKRVQKEESPEVEQSPFPFMKLPRELRDCVYELHLQSIYRESRPYDKEFQTKYSVDNFLSKQEGWRAKRGEVVFYSYFQPIYHEDITWANHYFIIGNTINSNWQVREYVTPELLTLQDESPLAKEVEEYFVESRLLVDTDSLNRFQDWCLKLPSTTMKRIHSLHIATKARYWPALESWPHVASIDLPIGDKPLFLIKIVDDGRELLVTSRFRVDGDERSTLRANLLTLITPSRRKKPVFDGEDVLEAMFAFHCKQVRPHRDDLMIGSMRKGFLSWGFILHPEEFQAGEALYPTRKSMVENKALISKIHGRGRVSDHIVFRARIDAGMLDD